MIKIIDKHYNLISLLFMIVGLIFAIVGPLPILDSDNNSFSILDVVLTIFCIFSLLISIIVYIKYKSNKILNGSKELPVNNRYLQSINMLVEEYLQSKQLVLPVSKYSKKLHINDLKRLAGKVFYSQRKYDEIVEILEEARSYAFTAKYANPRYDDEKITQEMVLGDWKEYFYKVLSDINIPGLTNLTVLNVGIGNGYESKGLFQDLHNFIAVDISETALNFCKNVFHNAKCIINSAENLKDISNSSIDLYISFRAFQSSLIDRRIAIHEAYRVLKIGGCIILSVPCLFINSETGRMLRGLIKDDTNIIEEDVLSSTVNELKEYLQILQFSKISIDIRSPYEIFITAIKS